MRAQRVAGGDELGPAGSQRAWPRSARLLDPGLLYESSPRAAALAPVHWLCLFGLPCPLSEASTCLEHGVGAWGEHLLNE